MKPEEFVIWLDGFLESNQDHNLLEDKIKIVSEKLSTVFYKVTESISFNGTTTDDFKNVE